MILSIVRPILVTFACLALAYWKNPKIFIWTKKLNPTLLSNFQLVEFFEEDSIFYLIFERMEGSLMEKLNRSSSIIIGQDDYVEKDGFD